MVGRAAAVLARRRVAAFVVAAAVVVAWFEIAPRVGGLALWPTILLVSIVVMPGTLLLALIALPLWREKWMFPAAVVLGLIAFGCAQAGWGLAGNFAKLWAAIFAGWAFIRLFEELSWVVLVAFVIPLVDIISVYKGPTKTITEHHFHIYTAVAIAFVVPGGAAAYLGPPDVLFYALFLAAAQRWHLRVVVTWIAMTSMYGFTVILATATNVDGLPALPFLSFGFLVANGDLLWRSIRRKEDLPASSA
jgi:hypothetical protein